MHLVKPKDYETYKRNNSSKEDQSPAEILHSFCFSRLSPAMRPLRAADLWAGRVW
jgi:hypothetical protein